MAGINNNCQLFGRLTTQPEIKKTSTNATYCDFQIAVEREFKNKDGEKETDFIDCRAWNQLADYLYTYSKKGGRVIVGGRIQVDNYQDQDGKNRKGWKIIADKVVIIDFSKDTKTEEKSNVAQPQEPQEKIEQQQEFNPEFEVTDDDLPF